MCLLCSSYHRTVWHGSFALDINRVPTHFSEAIGSGKVAWEHPLKSYQTMIKTTINIFARKQYILAGQGFFCESEQGLPSQEFPERRVGGFSWPLSVNHEQVYQQVIDRKLQILWPEGPSIALMHLFCYVYNFIQLLFYSVTRFLVSKLEVSV